MISDWLHVVVICVVCISISNIVCVNILADAWIKVEELRNTDKNKPNNNVDESL